MLCFNLSVLLSAVFYIPIVTFEEEIDRHGPHLKNLVVKIIEGNFFRRNSPVYCNEARTFMI